MSENQDSAAEAPAPCVDPVVVISGFLIVDGCKVARVEPGGVLAFPDSCRGRSQRRGTDQRRASVADVVRAVQEAQE